MAKKDERVVRPFDKETLRARILPFAVIICAGFLSIPLVLDTYNIHGLLLAAAVMAFTIIGSYILPWQDLGQKFEVTLPVLGILSIAILREATGQQASPYGSLILLSVLWVSLYGNIRDCFIIVIAAVAAFISPVWIFGYPQTELVRGLIFGAICFVTAYSINSLVRSLANSLSRNRYIVESAHDAYIVLDRNLIITHWNKEASNLFGYLPKEVLGAQWGKIVDASSANSLPDLIKGQQETGQDIKNNRRELLVIHKDGHKFSVEMTTAEIQEDGKTTYHLFMHDISERQRTKELLEEANQSLIKTNELKSQFVAMASHELRTPLTSILGFTQTMLDQKALTEKQREEFLQIINEQASRLNRLIEDLLTLSQVESGKLRMEKKVINVYEHIENILGRMSIEANILCRKDLEIYADSQHIEQIVVNYINNARKYGQGPYDITVEEDMNDISIYVRDHGVGVRPEFVPQLFERFSQEQREGGTGLGLSIVMGIAQAYNGRAWYADADPGSIFAVHLPDVVVKIPVNS